MQVGSGDNDTILALIRQFHPYEASNHIYIFPKCFLIDRLMMLTPAGCLCRYFVMSFYRIQMICVITLNGVTVVTGKLGLPGLDHHLRDGRPSVTDLKPGHKPYYQ